MKQLEILPTPNMDRGVSKLNLCQQCGSIIYVPATIDYEPKKLEGPCPVCGKMLWVLLKRPEGPFRWVE